MEWQLIMWRFRKMNRNFFAFHNKIIVIYFVLFLFGCVKQQRLADSRIDIPEGRMMEFAKTELQKFLSKADSALESSGGANTESWHFKMQIDPELPSYSFRVMNQKSDDGQLVVLSGNDSTCVLNAVYTMLEKLGFRFEITGPVISASGIQPENLINYNEIIAPVVQNRGVRQHINFPMDISGYTLEEAKEYIRNLARMRFNTITFHSYPEQWIERPEFAGAFFYGQRYDIPNDSLVNKHVQNKTTFCIPEIEPFFEDRKVRSEMAIKWLNNVMGECKRAGLNIQFSFEPYSTSHDVDETVKTCEAILKLYPQIDQLELITGQEILQEPSIKKALKTNLANCGTFYTEINHVIQSINKYREKHGVSGTPLSFGIYCVVEPWIDGALMIARKNLPNDVKWALLPGHSSQRVANYMKRLDFGVNEWQQTRMYSWIEFDGLMYLQQNGIPGIKMLLEDAQTDLEGKPLHGLCFNHWRTAENRSTARYAALACIRGAISEDDYYRETAQDLGIGNATEYTEAMNLLSEADWKATNELSNFGFCFLGTWLQNPNPENPGLKNLGYIGVWNPDTIRSVKKMYALASDKLKTCISQTNNKEGLIFLELLNNRLECTCSYFTAFEHGSLLRPIFQNKAPNDFSLEDKENIVKICNETLSLLDNYMMSWVLNMPDRGAEGTLISFYHTVPAYIKILRQKYGGIASEIEVKKENSEAPHSPIKE